MASKICLQPAEISHRATKKTLLECQGHLGCLNTPAGRGDLQETQTGFSWEGFTLLGFPSPSKTWREILTLVPPHLQVPWLCDLFCNRTDGETKGEAGESNACAGMSPDPLCSTCSMPPSSGGCLFRKGFPSWVSKCFCFQPPKGLNSAS